MTTEYTLRAAVFLAERAGASFTAHEIARETQVPADYLSKIMRDLCRANLVISRPGRNGGYALMVDAKSISLLDVVQAVEPIRQIDNCPLGRPCHAKELCPLHRAIGSAISDFVNRLSGTTLGSLCPIQLIPVGGIQ
ncbi:RrF2 family transcriptional regulator [soil metagenome]